MVELKAASVAMRLHRNRLSRRVRSIEAVRAIASSASIGGWAVWHELGQVWGSIIAATQVLDALKNVFPFVREQKCASDLTVALELLFIDAQQEWDRIQDAQLSPKVIMDRCTKLRKLQLDAERKHFPEGFEPDPALNRLAMLETANYMAMVYKTGAGHG